MRRELLRKGSERIDELRRAPSGDEKKGSLLRLDDALQVTEQPKAGRLLWDSKEWSCDAASEDESCEKREGEDQRRDRWQMVCRCSSLMPVDSSEIVCKSESGCGKAN